MQPTFIEQILRVRINLKVFGFYIGTGHYRNEFSDTESDSSSDLSSYSNF